MLETATISRELSCQTEFDPSLLSVEAARQKILDAVVPVTAITRVAVRSGLNRILAQNVRAKIDVPSHNNSAMDGYALNARDIPPAGAIQTLAVIGTAWAGKPFSGTPEPGECVRIMTGAVMPIGTDTVVMQEDVELEGNRIRLDSAHKTGQNVRFAGEDISAGAIALPRGKRLLPAELGLIASVGVAEVDVYRRLRAAFFSTGDELRSLGEPLETGQIYDSNRYTLYGMLERLGVEIIDMGVVRDRRVALEQAFREAASCADVIITSGGASVGEADFISGVLAEVGQIHFWKVAMKPGRPLAFGRVGSAVFFGLPGNPVSVMATFYQFVQPAIRRMMGEQDINPPTFKVRSAGVFKKRPGRVEFQRGILTQDNNGQLVVHTTGQQGSGILRSMSMANCFVILSQHQGRVEAGAMVDVQPFFGLV